MNIDWKLFRTLVFAGVTLIFVHEILTNWDDVKRGMSGGFKDGYQATRP